MSNLPIFDVAGSALQAQSVRLSTIASNLANADSVAGSPEAVYKPLEPVFQAQASGHDPALTGVRVRAWDRDGSDLDFEVKGLTAGTFQHVVDHLDGKVFLDRVEDTRSLTTWADFERFHMAAFVERAKALVAKHGS